VDALYQKELLSLVYIQVPILKSLRVLLESQPMDGGTKQAFLADLDRSLAKIQQSIQDKRWTIEPEERVY
jgi:hypothetical protein